MNNPSGFNHPLKEILHSLMKKEKEKENKKKEKRNCEGIPNGKDRNYIRRARVTFLRVETE